jgi:hypothetical protein
MFDVRTLLRLGAVLNLASAVAHFLAPGALLDTVSVWYERGLAVDFEPRPAATRRVRLLGIPFLVAAWLAWRLGDRLGGHS